MMLRRTRGASALVWLLLAGNFLGHAPVMSQEQKSNQTLPAPAKDMSETERVLAESSGGVPNPAVQRMDVKQYREAIDRLHPAFALSANDVAQAVEYGASVSKKDYGKVFGHLGRRVGDDLVTPYIPLKTAVYGGWKNAREYKPLPSAAEVQPIPEHHIKFLIQMNRANSSRELRDAKFVLRVQDGTHIQPVAPPKADKLKSDTYQGTRVYSYYNYLTKRTEYIARPEEDTYYSTAYEVVYDLLNPDGTPRILPGDTEVTLLLILNGEEKKAKFKLADWATSSLPRVKAKSTRN